METGHHAGAEGRIGRWMAEKKKGKEEGVRRRNATEQKRKTSEQIQSEKDGSGDQTQRRWRIS